MGTLIGLLVCIHLHCCYAGFKMCFVDVSTSGQHISVRTCPVSRQLMLMGIDISESIAGKVPDLHYVG